MNTPANETQENKSQTAANPVAQNQSTGEQTFQLADNRPEAIVQRKLHEMANNSWQQKRAVQLHAIANSHRSQQDVPLQKKAASGSATRANNTGLPNNLKSGIENLSGYSMDDVKVHRNSDKPAQLQAHAYAQGTDIHLGPGQEKHLPHEAWHVVQQKQGRVKPTMQLKGKVNVNDDAGLEKEADVMGKKAIQFKATNMDNVSKAALSLETEADKMGSKAMQNIPPFLSTLKNTSTGINSPMQMKIKANDFKGLIAEQIGIGGEGPVADKDEKHTTVGFEFEFATMSGANPFSGASHVEISKSGEKINGLPFLLETDASDALELVTPPLWIETISPDHPIPLQSEIEKVDVLAKERLKEITGDLGDDAEEADGMALVDGEDEAVAVEAAEEITMKTLVASFEEDGVKFPLGAVKVAAKNMSKKTKVPFGPGNDTVSKENVEAVGIEKIKKRGKIDTQINIATNVETFSAIEEYILKSSKRFDDDERYNHLYDYLMKEILDRLPQPEFQDIAASQKRLTLYGKVLTRYLSGLPAVPYSEWLQNQLNVIYNLKGAARDNKIKTLNGLGKQQQGQVVKSDWAPKDNPRDMSKFYATAATTSSHVKDINQVWLKDTIMNVGIGLLQKEDWTVVKKWLEKLSADKIMDSYSPPKRFYQFEEQQLEGEFEWKDLPQTELDRLGNMDKLLRKNLNAAINQIKADIEGFKLEEKEGNQFIGPLEQQQFLGHTGRWIGARQDTYVDGPAVSLPAMWPKTRLHVVELRMGNIGEVLKALEDTPPELLGETDQTVGAVRLISEGDWLEMTGFQTPQAVNFYLNAYVKEKQDGLVSEYDITKNIEYEPDGAKGFIKWLNEKGISPAKKAASINMSHSLFLKFIHLYNTFKGDPVDELDLLENQWGDFKKLIKVGYILKRDTYKQLNPPEIWKKIKLYNDEKGLTISDISVEEFLVWKAEKDKKRYNEVERNNPWAKK
jgi:hypothetical protein